jgi:hypothetical protein
MNVTREASVRALHFGEIGADRDSERTGCGELARIDRGVHSYVRLSVACDARRFRRLRRALTQTRTAREKFFRQERAIGERAAWCTKRDAKTYLRVRQQLENAKTREELTTQTSFDDRWRETKVGREHFTVQALRSHRAKERTPQRLVVDRFVCAKNFGKRLRCAIDFDRDDQARRKMNAMRPPARHAELQRPRRRRAMHDAEEIPKRRRSQSTRKLHPC